MEWQAPEQSNPSPVSRRLEKTPGASHPLPLERENEYCGDTMTRRTMLWSPMLLGAKRAWAALASGLTGPWGKSQAAAGPVPAGDAGTKLQTPNHTLGFDEKTGRLLSLRSVLAPDQEFVVTNDAMPVFVIQHLTAEKRFEQI